MASNFCSYKNTQQAVARLNQPKEILVETTSTPSIASILSQVLASIPAPALYIQKNLQKITKFCMDSLLQRNCQERPQESQLKA